MPLACSSAKAATLPGGTLPAACSRIAGGGAIWSRVGRFRPMVTVDLRLDYLRPARKGERVHARCQCDKITRQIAFVRGIAHVGDPDDPIAHSASTFMFLD